MRTASAAHLVICVAAAAAVFPASVATASLPLPGTATNLLWLLNAPASASAHTLHSPSSLLWALNATLGDDHITFHYSGATPDSPVQLHARSHSAPTHVPLQPFDAARLASLATWTTNDVQTDASQTELPSPPWQISLRPTLPRPLKLKGSKIPKFADDAIQQQQPVTWLLTAQSTLPGAGRELPLLEVTPASTTAQQSSGQHSPLQFTVHPVGLSTVEPTWSSDRDTEATLKSWESLDGLASAPSPSLTSNDDAVRAFARRPDGSYFRLFRTPTTAQQPNSHALPWSWPSALGAMGKWSTGVDGQAVSDRVHHECHRLNQAFKQASPFKGTSRPFLTKLRTSLPRPQLNASALTTKVHGTQVGKALGRPAAAVSGVASALMRALAKQWREADGPKQTFMAVFAILQVVWLACTVKSWLDRLFGRKVEYRNRRTRSLARKAALAAVGACSAGRGKPRSGNWCSGKPKLPPRPTAGHPLMPVSGGGSQRASSSNVNNEKKPHQQSVRTLSATNELATTASGDIILPSWTEDGPSSLMVIVEEPELEEKEADDIDERQRQIYTHSKKRSDWDRMAGEWDGDSEDDDASTCLKQGWSSSNLGAGVDRWSSRPSLQCDGGSLRYRERNAAASLPFYDDVVSVLPPMPLLHGGEEGAAVGELDAGWSRADRAEMERGWRDSCMEEGVFDARQQ